MGQIFANITLKNAVDVGMVDRGLIKEPEIRQTAVRAMVDTGAATLIINELVRAQLGLKVQTLRQTTLANDQKEICKVTEPVVVHWNDRSMTCQPWVIPGSGDVLLGLIPLEDMDLVINPLKEELVGAHGDEIIGMLK